MTDFDNVSLQESLNEVDLKIKIDISQKVFIDLLNNKINFLKLNNISFYKTVN